MRLQTSCSLSIEQFFQVRPSLSWKFVGLSDRLLKFVPPISMAWHIIGGEENEARSQELKENFMQSLIAMRGISCCFGNGTADSVVSS